MTATNGLNSQAGGSTAALLRRCAANVVTALKILARPAKTHPPRSWSKPWPLPPQQLAIAAAVALAVFLLGMLFIDAAAINAVAHLPRWLVWFFDVITDFGKSGWFLWPLGILFLALAALSQGLSRMSQRVLAAVMVRVGFLFVAIVVPGIFTNIVKHIFGRARPGVGGSIDPSLFSPFSWPAAYASLPSGHATTAFSVLVIFGSLWPRARTMLLIYALLIAASRIVVTAHYPTDVAAGALVGVLGAMMVRRFFALRGLGFSIGPDGALRQLPGPSFKRIKSVARELLT
ncbi:MAG: phosphatase PAP2 family protein [Rhizobiales bacterium]|nr:phosphatase PAP2 family protein [Hyphomicrobiales bacterium]